MFIISIKENPMTTPHLANTVSAVSAVSAAPTQETASDVPFPGARPTRPRWVTPRSQRT